MKAYKTKEFHQWTRKLNLEDRALQKAIDELLLGLYEANLGGHLYKKRIAVGHKGKSGGLRTIIAFKKGFDVFFIYGFAKNKRANISDHEKILLKELASDLFLLNSQQIAVLITKNELIEVS